jgi:hypothetical protein
MASLKPLRYSLAGLLALVASLALLCEVIAVGGRQVVSQCPGLVTAPGGVSCLQCHGRMPAWKESTGRLASRLLARPTVWERGELPAGHVMITAGKAVRCNECHAEVPNLALQRTRPAACVFW